MEKWLNAAAQQRLHSFSGRNVGIVGLGREGVDLARFLGAFGAHITLSDTADETTLGAAVLALHDLSPRYLLGEQRASDLLDCDEVLVSPGVPRSVPVVAAAAAAGIPISSATRLYFELCPGPILAVTGSSGKTTTTTLIGNMLRAAGLPTVMGGNMGTPMLAQLRDVDSDTWSVMELSSFQLDDLTQSPRIGAVLNITPNHLDRHPDMDDYIRAKGNLIRFQRSEDVAILNADDPIVSNLAHVGHSAWFSLKGPVSGAWLEGNDLLLGGLPSAPNSMTTTETVRLVSRYEIPLRGIHNVANVLAASAAAASAGSSAESISTAIRAFRAVPHRIEIVATVDGVTYVNDSIATSPERSMAALASFEEPVILIAGGRDKHLPMLDWARMIGARARGIVLVGEASAQIDAALDEAQVSIPRERAGSFAESIRLATALARAGDVVLLSPGCTSFDEFRDYEARGEAFRVSVADLVRGGGNGR